MDTGKPYEVAKEYVYRYLHSLVKDKEFYIPKQSKKF